MQIHLYAIFSVCFVSFAKLNLLAPKFVDIDQQTRRLLPPPSAFPYTHINTYITSVYAFIKLKVFALAKGKDKRTPSSLGSFAY